MSERELRERMAVHGKSLFDRGLTSGSTGNLSVRLADGFLLTPTNSCLGRLDPDLISKIDSNGRHLSGDHPSKEWPLHLAMYEARPQEQAIVHLHSTYSVAVSCLEQIDHNDVLPALTAYYIMRVGRLPLIPYFPPGDERLAEAVSRFAEQSHAVLLSNHGPVVAGQTLESAVYATEELEETARLFLLLQNQAVRCLTPSQVEELRARFS